MSTSSSTRWCSTSSPAGNKKIAELVPGARYEGIADARHIPKVERAEAFNKIMLPWLASHR